MENSQNNCVVKILNLTPAVGIVCVVLALKVAQLNAKVDALKTAHKSSYELGKATGKLEATITQVAKSKKENA